MVIEIEQRGLHHIERHGHQHRAAKPLRENKQAKAAIISEHADALSEIVEKAGFGLWRRGRFGFAPGDKDDG